MANPGTLALDSSDHHQYVNLSLGIGRKKVVGRVWNGTTAAFTTAANWSPAGIPGSGDMAAINAGTVSVTGTDLAPNLRVFVNSGAVAPTLLLADATIAIADYLTFSASGSTVSTLKSVGRVVNYGTVIFQDGTGSSTTPDSQLTISGNFTGQSGSFVNIGVVELQSQSTLIVAADSNPLDEFTNNGSVLVRSLAYQHSDYASDRFDVPVTGTGTMHVGWGTRLEFVNAVSAGQTIWLDGGGGYAAVLTIDNPMTFGATIAGFSASDSIVVTTPAYTGTQVSTSNGITTLSFSAGSAVVGAIQLQGTYTASQFRFATITGTSTVKTFINTSALDTALPTVPTGSGTVGAGAGGGTGSVGAGAGATPLPSVGVYRFFDTRFGTHFFTADANEASGVASGRSDLTNEGIGLHALNPAANDPNAVTVYRFFDNVFGTHFFTASVSESATLISTRKDLTFEASSTFLEHSTPQSGDVAVYRYFDTVHGTHFYTADTAERASIAATRTDLVSEGISFYAPTS